MTHVNEPGRPPLDDSLDTSVEPDIYFDDPPAPVNAYRDHVRHVIWCLLNQMDMQTFIIVRHRVNVPSDGLEEMGNKMHMTKQAVWKVVERLRRNAPQLAFLFPDYEHTDDEEEG